jgi:cell division protein FtsZ
MHFEIDQGHTQRARIKVVGVGGAGGNAINRMVDSGLQGVEYIAINTDAMDLERSKADVKISLGHLGAGANPEVGRKCIEEHREEVRAALEGSDMVFITAGMGGGTGTGAAPVVAELCREMGILSVAVVTKPFLWEGPVRRRNAQQGIDRICMPADTLITIQNQRLLSIIEKSTSFDAAFSKADEVLVNAVRGISEIILKPGRINVDFADVRAVMQDGKDAIMGIGTAEGENRALVAAQRAIESPLLDDVSINGASGLLINICGSEAMTMMEVNEVMSFIYESVGEESSTNIIFGVVIDETMQDRVAVTVIATGFDQASLKHEAPAPVAVAPAPLPTPAPAAYAAHAAPTAAMPATGVRPMTTARPMTSPPTTTRPMSAPVAQVAMVAPAPQVSQPTVIPVRAKPAPVAVHAAPAAAARPSPMIGSNAEPAEEELFSNPEAVGQRWEEDMRELEAELPQAPVVVQSAPEPVVNEAIETPSNSEIRLPQGREGYNEDELENIPTFLRYHQ